MRIRWDGTSICVEAPAKINLFLEVIAQLSSGFHELETLMFAVGIYDSIRFTATDADAIDFQCTHSDTSTKELQPSDEDNLVFRALTLLKRESGTLKGAAVQLHKRIPMQAGMGGGSSNAAAALRIANLGWNLNWSPAQLLPLAESLGSDVPFFMEDGPAVCRGRGERITRLPKALRIPLVIAFPGVGLSTARVFQDCPISASPDSVSQMLAAIDSQSVSAVGATLRNRLQTPAIKLAPAIAQLSHDFEQLGCYGHQMTGSGSGYFGLCRSLRHARRTARKLHARGWKNVTSTTTVH